MSHRVLSPAQFFHGSHDRLQPGTVLEPGHARNHELSGNAVYVHPDPGIAAVFAHDFHGPSAAVYEVHAPGARPDDPQDPWNSEHLTDRAVIRRKLSMDEAYRISDHLPDRGLTA